ncbi:Glucose/sorbosone dehydrogenase-like protein [Candidatus Promineifilum breve]|uniref:Glucose/sorbosone dehydrogenase-like protein n=2 Tax=Candidatus Promineifilum breve TaxID=1806508 RepID=A0A170PDP0_9CHLR|nr:Glucose/sorbosone dehydrogenase-like protein [Candidatus Promineifilum breve]
MSSRSSGRFTIMDAMQKLLLIVVALCGSLLIGCGGGEVEPPAAPETTPVVTSATLPAPAVTLEATNTYIPFVESEPTATPNATPTLEATTVPSPTPQSPVASVALEPVIAQGLLQPTFLTHAFDERLFVTEQVGLIRIIEDGQLLETPFLDITDRVGATASEQGLLGLAFHPDYADEGAANQGQFYVNYTDFNGDTHIARFSVMADDPYRADPDSEVDYLTVDQPYPNHNGGMLAFGPDGYLYAGLGDGGSANDPLGAGQSLTTVLGKILRLDVAAEAEAYAIPADNPFVATAGAQPEIWAYGVRNPWRFSFDRQTGDLFMGDVGQNIWEEVNFQPAASAGGENYGWNIMEATHCFESETCDQTGLTLPIFEYQHDQGCSVTGGYIYRGLLYPEMGGNYFVADYCSGIIWRLFPQGGGWLADVVLDSDLIISSFGEDVNGEVYAISYGNGGIYRITPGQ